MYINDLILLVMMFKELTFKNTTCLKGCRRVLYLLKSNTNSTSSKKLCDMISVNFCRYLSAISETKKQKKLPRKQWWNKWGLTCGPEFRKKRYCALSVPKSTGVFFYRSGPPTGFIGSRPQNCLWLSYHNFSLSNQVDWTCDLIVR